MDLPPIVISRPADAQLSASPIPREWIVEGAPQARAAVLSKSNDGMATSVVWETSKGAFRWYFSIDETVNILDGEVFVTDEKNVERKLAAGDVAYFPAGVWSTWRVPERLRKIAYIRNPVSPPLAWISRGWNKIVSWVTPKSKAPTIAPAQTVEANAAVSHIE